MRILEPDEIGKLLKVAPDRYRPILALAFGTGLRLGEVLGLTWADVDAKAGVLHVRKQANRKGNRVAPKTAQAVRAVNLPSSLVTMLREYRMASRHKAGSDFVFASSTGTALGHRNVTRRGLDVAADEAGLNPPGLPRLRFHDARHAFASLLVSWG